MLCAAADPHAHSVDVSGTSGQSMGILGELNPMEAAANAVS